MGSRAVTRESQRVSQEEIWFKTRNAVIDYYLPVIGTTAFSVYGVLLRRAGMDASGYPGRRDIARKTGTSVDAVDRALKRLTGEDGRLAASGLKTLIRKEYQRHDHGGLKTNRYHILTGISTEGPADVPRRRKQRKDFGAKRPRKASSEPLLTDVQHPASD